VEIKLFDIFREFKNLLDIRKRAIIKELTDQLENDTPVDTGYAKNHWQFTDNEIRNETEYISELNEGSSKQAPAYFIEKTVLNNRHVEPNGVIVSKI
jgi:hypothetical protein